MSFFFFLFFMTTMQFILLNMFVAFITNAYSKVNEEFNKLREEKKE